MKLKWFVCKYPCSLTEVKNKLLQNQFKLDSEIGFDVLDYSESHIYSSFLEKINLSEEITDPFGNQSIVTSVKYNQFSFRCDSIVDDLCLLAIEEPPTSIKSLTAKLSDIFGVGFFIKNIELDLSRLIDFLIESEDVNRLDILKIRASGIKVNKDSIAKIELSSRKDALKDLNEFNKFGGCKIDRIVLRVDVGNVAGNMEVSSTTLCKIDDVIEPWLSKLIVNIIDKSI